MLYKINFINKKGTVIKTKFYQSDKTFKVGLKNANAAQKRSDEWSMKYSNSGDNYKVFESFKTEVKWEKS